MMIFDYIIISLKSILILPLIFFIPGLLINSIIYSNKSLRFDYNFILNIYVSIIITSITGLLLAQLGIFSLFNIFIILFLISILSYLKLRQSNFKFEFKPSLKFTHERIIFILLIISAIFLFFQPFPWIAGGRDPGVYVSSGVHIAKSGSIFIKDPLIAQMNTSIQEALYDVEPASVYGFISWENPNLKFQFPGFFITDLTSGIITPQFLHLFPVWIAIFYSIFGLMGIFFVNPVFGLLSIGSFYLLGKKLFSWKVAALACFLLVLNFAQIWYSRYPFAEIMTQFFILSWLATFICFNRTSDKYIAVISALMFGLAFLTKLDGIFILIPLSIYYIYVYITKKWNFSHKYFLFTLLIMLIYCSIDYFIFSKPYINFLIDFATKSPPYYSGIKFNVYNNLFINGHILSWYLTEVGILITLIGSAIILSKRKNPEEILLVFIALIFTIAYFIKLEETNPPPWTARRYVPIVIPLFALFASYAIKEISHIKKIGLYISSLLILYLVLSLAITSDLIINHKEGDGLILGLSRLSENFNENDIIIMGSSREGYELSTPLYYVYDKKVIFLNKYNTFPDIWIRELTPPEKISTGINYLLNKGYDIYIVSTNHIYIDKLLYYLSENHKIDLVSEEEISYKHLDPTPDNLLPGNIVNVTMKLNIYKILNNKSTIFMDPIYSIDIGSPLDVQYIEDGFYEREKNGNSNSRWTSRNASVRIPTSGKNNLIISLYAGGFRPKNVSPANVIVLLNEHVIGNFTVREEYELNNMTVNKDFISNPYSTLRIISNTWKPFEYLGNQDHRDLGINVDKISIVPVPFIPSFPKDKL